jgi:hypothetical protein
MSEGIDYDDVLYNFESFHSQVLLIRDAAIDQDEFTEKQTSTLVDLALGFGCSFSLIEVINLLKDPDIIKLASEKQRIKENEYVSSERDS